MVTDRGGGDVNDSRHFSFYIGRALCVCVCYHLYPLHAGAGKAERPMKY